PGPPDARHRDGWRHLAADALAATAGIVPGPVHLNLAFREPLVGPAGPLPEPDGATGRPAPPVWGLLDEQVARLVGLLAGRRGVVVAGARAATSTADTDAVVALATQLGWPVLSDHQSGCRRGHPCEVRTFDSL